MQKKHTLLWTSGWDSIFRLLEIILIEKELVQPIYIIDEDRKSLKNELNSIDLILKKIENDFPTSRELILPMKFFKKSEIVISPEIKSAFELVKKSIKIGSQYEWISALCEQEKFTEVELCIFKNERTDILFDDSKESEDKTDNRSELNEAIKLIFKYYSFPVLKIDKMDMYTISKNNNWLEIMKLTWFCHKPKKGKPCGKCNPCKIAVKEGLGFRIPFINRMEGRLKNIFSK